MTVKGSRKTRSSYEEADVRNARIRAAGVVQAVIASGAPVEEWQARASYGLRLVNHWAARLLKKKLKEPNIPESLKGK